MLKINKEFQNLIPTLTKEEYQTLEENIIKEGCRDSLVIWNDTIIDGHNRFEICNKNNIEFATIEKQFDTKEEVIEWIIRNQFGRRNLSIYDRSKLAIQLKEILIKKSKEKENLRKTIEQTKPLPIENMTPEQKAIVSVLSGYKKQLYTKPDKIYFVQNEDKVKIGCSCDVENRIKDITKHIPDAKLIGTCEGGRELESEIHKTLSEYKLHNEWYKLNDITVALIKSFIPNADFTNICKVNSTKEAADKFNISHETLRKVEKIEEKAPIETKKKLSTGEMTINQAYKEVRQEEKRNEIKEDLKPIELPKGFYDVIYCDPPWKYDFAETESRAIENHYPTMTVEEMKSLQIPAAENSVMLMWATAPKLEQALELLKAWGFTYKTNAVWDKEVIGMGYWFRGQHEFLLVGTKGSYSPPKPENRYSSVIREKRTAHSKKPLVLYNMIEKMFPNARYLELFSRNKFNDNWNVWGNQL